MFDLHVTQATPNERTSVREQSLVDLIADAVMERGKKTSSGHVLIFDALNLRNVIREAIDKHHQLTKP